MTCLQVKISVSPIAICSLSVGLNETPPLKCIATRIGRVSALANRVKTHPLACKISDVLSSGHLKISCGIVCSVSQVFYLQVSPEEVQWITPEEGIIYTVNSNVNWIIE